MRLCACLLGSRQGGADRLADRDAVAAGRTFFFEPRGYDHINHATHEHKEEIKVGYNLNRKIVLLSIWVLSPLPLYFDPTLFGIFEPHRTTPNSSITSA